MVILHYNTNNYLPLATDNWYTAKKICNHFCISKSSKLEVYVGLRVKIAKMQLV